MKEMISFEPPETILITFRGTLDAGEVEKMFEKWDNYIKPGEKQKVLLSADELDELPPKAREALRKGASRFQMSKLAIYGASTKMRIMGGLIIKMLPNVDASTFMETEEEARAWLAEK